MTSIPLCFIDLWATLDIMKMILRDPLGHLSFFRMNGVIQFCFKWCNTCSKKDLIFCTKVPFVCSSGGKFYVERYNYPTTVSFQKRFIVRPRRSREIQAPHPFPLVLHGSCLYPGTSFAYQDLIGCHILWHSNTHLSCLQDLHRFSKEIPTSALFFFNKELNNECAHWKINSPEKI